LNGGLVSEQRVPRERAPKPRGKMREQELDLEEERRAFRELIERFRCLPESDDNGFYRNVGRFFVRTRMKAH
jgi:hypothetical protein